MLSSNNVLTHFDQTLPVGIACDASYVGIGAVLFHRYPDGSERPIANASKTLTDSQRNYSQIQKKALAIVYALKKFYQYLFGRKFILMTDHKPLLSLFGPNKATPALAANRLARWALFLNQFSYDIVYRKTSEHQNTDVLSRLPVGQDPVFDGKESAHDVDTVCNIRTLSLQVQPSDSYSLQKETAKDPTLTKVMRYTREGWPAKFRVEDINDPAESFRKIKESLSTCYGCLLYGSRAVIPESIRPKVLKLLHEGHLGMQRMKQLARTAVYWPNIDRDIVDLCRKCNTCAVYQNAPSKVALHPWMSPEKPWSRLHVDHAINFMGYNWLLLIDAYSKYPCIHPTQSISAKTTIDLLENDFSHFGYPHTLVTDNAPTFMSEQFQNYCKERGIVHVTGAPYHPATNGAAERLVQTFKQALRKSSSPPKEALLEFLMQYRRTPAGSGYSPSELSNHRQMRTKIDALLPSPAHTTQGIQSKIATKSQFLVRRANVYSYKVGDPCYVLYFGPRHNQQPRWVAAKVIKRHGCRSVEVRVIPRGPIWRRHIEQLRPRYATEEDENPADDPNPVSERINEEIPDTTQSSPPKVADPEHLEYGPGNPRRSKRQRKPRQLLCC
uniref:Gypsy retrotransposon integrase-like protein 1 n=1 Tax=Phallusia mammillata TaxID=59560 RepID=A0A6F9D7S3_9ASCI|nr:uncharacterized protein K02A2.6-like [Phallusia mammillata]